MKDSNLIRVWAKTSHDKKSGGEHHAQLSQNPAGICELTDADLATVQGGDGGPWGWGGDRDWDDHRYGWGNRGWRNRGWGNRDWDDRGWGGSGSCW